ncbi:MAG: 5-carboxymethyl-2-hydroxymuconate Delta-isomerase [Alphaproteobacteria bacterium]|nr:MAG: 5-carboxymethyl-2-hydroxymuconate Delta-isomerase [Alphaproteobacteria bacterium]
MPHLVIEHSRDDDIEVLVPAMMNAAHRASLDSGLFDELDIKVRAYPCDHALVAGRDEKFIHVTVYLLSGRDDAAKKDLAMRVLDRIDDIVPPVASLSVDIRDMNRAAYSKRTA